MLHQVGQHGDILPFQGFGFGWGFNGGLQFGKRSLSGRVVVVHVGQSGGGGNDAGGRFLPGVLFVVKSQSQGQHGQSAGIAAHLAGQVFIIGFVGHGVFNGRKQAGGLFLQAFGRSNLRNLGRLRRCSQAPQAESED